MNPILAPRSDRLAVPLAPPDRRVQRREFRDYQPLLMLVNQLDIISEPVRREFVCVTGPVWTRYNEASKGASQRRIAVLFLSNEHNGFDELLFVGCDYVLRQEHHCRVLWDGHPLCEGVGEQAVRRMTAETAGRSVLRTTDLGLPGERADGTLPGGHGTQGRRLVPSDLADPSCGRLLRQERS